MTDLDKKALGGLARFLVVLAILLFLPAWTLDYWQAWLFLAVFSASTLAITVYLMRKDENLLRRRMNAGPAAEKERSQQIIQFIAALAFIATIVFPALDHRFAWSAVSVHVVLAGDALVAIGFGIMFFVFKANSFAAATIAVDAEQKVVSTGPYAIVRHPMYIGALIMLLGVPLALGSWWGLLTVIPIALAIVWRLLDEERFLARSLPGYTQYCDIVRYRLVPLVW
jgi:protein-S-isoprenylcysteine O-methyltransferase Ste14